MGNTEFNAKKRNSGLDLLRCIAMMMVVVLHFLGKGELLPDMSKPESWNAVGICGWTIEAVCIVAVNVYMLISGYVLCESRFKLSRLITLYIQVWFYSVVVGLVSYVCGLIPAGEFTTYDKLVLLLPISMGHYWFMTAYIYFFLLLPILTVAVKHMNKRQMGTVVVLLLIFHSALKSILPVVLEVDAKGYDFLWYTVLFLVAAYIKKFNPKFVGKGASLVCFLVGVLGALVEVLALGKISMMTGSFTLILTVSMHYNHIFPLLASVGLFGMFKDMDIRSGMAKVIGAIAPYTLGVYLLHENIGPRYVWQGWFGASRVSSVGMLVLFTLLAMVTVFVAGVVIDFIRKLLFTGLHRLLSLVKPYKCICQAILKVDGFFANEKEA